MRSIAGALALLVVLAIVGLVVLRQTQHLAPPGVAASGGLPAGGPAERSRAAQARAAESVARAMDAASAARGAADPP